MSAAADTHGARLFGACLGCHGMDAAGSADGRVPALAGQHYRYLLKQMEDFREGERLAGCCHESDSEPTLLEPLSLEHLSAYLSRLSGGTRAVKGTGHALARASELYRAACQACHLENGTGLAELGVPSLRAQHYPYLVSQITDIARSHRFNTPADLILLTRGMTRQEIALVADYLSRMGSPETMLVHASPGADPSSAQAVRRRAWTTSTLTPSRAPI